MVFKGVQKENGRRMFVPALVLPSRGITNKVLNTHAVYDAPGTISYALHDVSGLSAARATMDVAKVVSRHFGNFNAIGQLDHGEEGLIFNIAQPIGKQLLFTGTETSGKCMATF